MLSLKNNTVLPEKLFIFQDGLKPDEDDCEWKKVNELIQKIDWCENEIIISDYNKGLAASIISGVKNMMLLLCWRMIVSHLRVLCSL